MRPRLVEVFIEAVKRKAGISRDDQLADALGVAKSTVSSWRRRDRIPSVVARAAFEKFDVDIAGLRNGLALEDQLRRDKLQTVFYRALFEASAHFRSDLERLAEFAGWVGAREKEVRRLLGVGDIESNDALGLAEAIALEEKHQRDRYSNAVGMLLQAFHKEHSKHL